MSRLLDILVKLSGKDAVVSGLDDVEKKGTEVAESMERNWKEVGQKFEEMGGKISQIGGVLTQNVTVPIMAIGAAAVAMSLDVLHSEEAISKMSDTGRASVVELQTAIDTLTGGFEDLKIIVAESVMPTITDLTTNVLIPLLETVGDLAEKGSGHECSWSNSAISR